MNYKLLNGSTLAYIGDSIYETYIREHLINRSLTKVNDLHKSCIKYTSGKAQSYIISKLTDCLTDEELEIFKRGRNSNTNARKSTSIYEYKQATGFESIIGYLYLEKNIERLDFLIKESIKIIDEVE